VAAYKSGQDVKILGELYARYMELIYGVCLKYLKEPEDARDAVLNVFEELVPKLLKYEVENFRSWLYQLAKNHCLMKIRQNQGKISSGITEEQIPDDTDPASMHQHLEKDRKLELMSNSLDELGHEQKQCVTLFYLEKKSYQQIAEVTGFTVMQVKSYIQNGKRNLKLILEKKIKNQ